MMYRLTLFGPPSLVDEAGETPAGLGPGKPLAVLCYLAREGEVRRETVAALLWGETSEAKARNAFRQALHRLRSALGEEMIPHDTDTVRIAGGADLRVDAAEFERALSDGRPDDAVELVQGDFLEGFAIGEPGFDHWADGERARLRGRFMGALRDAARGALAEGRLEEAVLHARRLAEEDPLDAAAAVLEAKTLTAAGRGEAARRLLEEHASRYREEVGDDPPEEVAEALAGLRGDEDIAESAGHPAAAEPTLRPEPLNALLGAWRATTAEYQAGVVLLEGERGSGKTWLLDELIRRIRPLDRPIVLRGAERMGRHGLPYAPLAEALRGVLRARGLAGASTHLLAEAARILPELRDRFDLPIPAPIDDETGRLRFFEGVASVLDAVAFEQPVLLALEGLEDSDEPTLELVHFLTSRLGDAAILFVLSCDSGRGGRIRERFGAMADTVTLGRMDPRRIEELLETRLPGLGPMARAEVAAASDGSPGRAMELGQRRLRGEPIGGPPVPMEDVLRSRIAGRSPRERRILLVLALVGRPLTVRLLAAATHLPEGAVLEQVAPLRTAGLIREREHGVELPEGPAGRLVLESAGSAGRGLLAGWTLEALVSERAATDAELSALAVEAGRREEAARYAEAAGRTAARVGAHDLAREHFERAREWASEPATRARVERALAGLGGGGLRLGSGSGPGGADAAGGVAGPGAGAAAGASGPGSPAAPGDPAVPRSRTRLGLLVGALGTVVALVLLGIVELPDFGRSAAVTGRDRVVRDTLVLVRTDPDGSRTRLAFTGDPATALDRRAPVLGPAGGPRWADSLRAAGLPALVSPDGERVAVEGGVDGARALLAVSVDRSDTARLDAGATRFDPLGWGPEGNRLLYRRTEAGGSRTLWATAIAGGAPVPVDITGREVVEAAWSPDGTRVAWTARRGAGAGAEAEAEADRDGDGGTAEEGGRGRAVYVAFADGTEPRPLTDHSTDDYHLAWAPRGERVAFTSDRAGNAEIYAVEVRSGRLWRLTWDEAHDDRAAFSPDGEYLAFESTRGGEAAVYVISSWGGQPARVTGPGQRVQHAGWRGYPPPHLSHLRFRVPDPLRVGERARLAVEPVFDDYVSRNTGFVRWRALDPRIVGLAEEGPGEAVASGGVASAAVADTFVVARGEGLGRVAVSAGGWREDTVFVKVGEGAVVVEEGPVRGRGWSDAGDGRLSNASYPVEYGLSVELEVPGGVGADAEGGLIELALVTPQSGAGGSRGTVLELARLTVDRATGEVQQVVEREEHGGRIPVGRDAGAAADPDQQAAGSSLRLQIAVGEEGRVSFAVGDSLRWRSSLRLMGAGLPVHRVRVRVVGADSAGEAELMSRVEVGGQRSGDGDTGS